MVEKGSKKKTIIFCVKCGAWGIRKCMNLAEHCPGNLRRGTSGSTALGRIAKGLYPAYVDCGKLSGVINSPQSLPVADQARGRHSLVVPAPGSRLDIVLARIQSGLSTQ